MKKIIVFGLLLSQGFFTSCTVNDNPQPITKEFLAEVFEVKADFTSAKSFPLSVLRFKELISARQDKILFTSLTLFQAPGLKKTCSCLLKKKQQQKIFLA